MAQQSVVVPEMALPHNSPALFPYPPPRAVRKKYQMELGINGWVESMRASSPTHAKDDEHAAWKARHPSALGNFEQIVAASEGKKVVVFLDYDGTLAPIVDDPDAAYMSDTMRMAVRSVAKRFPTAIVSGRCRDKVYEFVRLAELYYAGSHGMDIQGPAKQEVFQPASEFLPMIQQVHESLLQKTRRIPGCKVENNKFCVSVHFRRVEERSWSAVADAVRAALRGFPRLRLTQGRKVLEVRPAIHWDKGKALEFLLHSLGLAGDRAGVLPLYIGDDRSDEDAFRVLRERGQGVGILVSKHPRDTSAAYSLQEPAEVMDFLLRLVDYEEVINCPTDINPSIMIN